MKRLTWLVPLLAATVWCPLEAADDAGGAGGGGDSDPTIVRRSDDDQKVKDAGAAKDLSPSQRIEKALQMKLDALDDKEHTLSELLQLFGKITSENFVLDPSLPKAVGDTRMTVRVRAGDTVLDAFAVTLALAGLRYAILDGTVFVSTEGKLADRLLYGGNAAAAVGQSAARQPMTVGDAVVRSQPFDPYQDEFITARDFISNTPWRHWEPARYNPKTGLTDFPGPPVWMEDPDIGNPRFRYTSSMFFLKPEYLALEQEKAEFRQAQADRAAAERASNDRALSALVELLKQHPDMKAEEVLKKLGIDEKK